MIAKDGYAHKTPPPEPPVRIFPLTCLPLRVKGTLFTRLEKRTVNATTEYFTAQVRRTQG